MNGREFFDLVAAMRCRQREYYATRNHDALKAAKMLEQRVDDEVARVHALLRREEERRESLPETRGDQQNRYAEVEKFINEHRQKQGAAKS